MIKKIIPLLISTSFMLISCGGEPEKTETQKDIPKLESVLLPSNDSSFDLKDAPKHNIYMLSNKNQDPKESVKIQSEFSDKDAILYFGNTKFIGFEKTKDYVDEADANKFKYAYVYDEVFWFDNKIQIGKDEDKILELAKYIKNKNMKTVVSIMPYVILDDKFNLKEINTYDVIAIDVYPSMMPTKDTKNCKYNENIYTNLLYCSQKKLHDLGYKGEVWYVYQAFGMHEENISSLIENLKIQRNTINEVHNFGITTVVPFGYYLSKEDIEAEPYLYQGYKSAIDSYVRY